MESLGIFLISSALATESITPIPIIANALHTADVSAFSNAASLFTNPLPHLACEYHVNILFGFSISGTTNALTISISQSFSLWV
jgi:hypothetical protein